MDVWTRILQIMSLTMERPEPYGWFHLLSLAVTAVLSVVLARRARDWSGKQIRAVVLVTAVLVLALEVYKQIQFTFGDGSKEAGYQWYIFPFQFCSTPMYVGLLAGLTRKGKLHEMLCAYLSTYAVFAGTAVMLYPTTVFIEVIGINI